MPPKFRIIAYTNELVLPIPSNISAIARTPRERRRERARHERRRDKLQAASSGTIPLHQQVIPYLAKFYPEKGKSLEEITEYLRGIGSNETENNIKEAMGNYVEIGSVKCVNAQFILTDVGYNMAVDYTHKHSSKFNWKPVF